MNYDYTLLLKNIEEELELCLPENPTESWMNTVFDSLPLMPEQYIRTSMIAPALNLVRRGGKRWRPLLTVLTGNLYGNSQIALKLSPLVELAHNGSLILDDIEDKSTVRRGLPAVHILFGDDNAINAGCLLYFLPTVLIDNCNLSQEIKLNIHSAFSKRMRCLHLGQAMDINWHRDEKYIPPQDQYELMTRMKTGVLARFAFELGALANGKNLIEVNEIAKYFEDVGVAFQIIDDVKNLTTGNPGKKRGDDVVEGKRSLPLIFMLREHPEYINKALEYFANAKQEGISSDSVEKFIQLIESTNALKDAQSYGLSMIETACAKINEYFPSSDSKNMILELIHSFI